MLKKTEIIIYYTETIVKSRKFVRVATKHVVDTILRNESWKKKCYISRFR